MLESISQLFLNNQILVRILLSIGCAHFSPLLWSMEELCIFSLEKNDFSRKMSVSNL